MSEFLALHSSIQSMQANYLVLSLNAFYDILINFIVKRYLQASSYAIGTIRKLIVQNTIHFTSTLIISLLASNFLGIIKFCQLNYGDYTQDITTIFHYIFLIYMLNI